jgi:hypothetical protein
LRNVALFGQMASGKSSIAAALVDSGYVQLAFAQPLKNISELAYGKIDKSGVYQVTDLDGTDSTISGREVLQRVGQSIKSHDRDFWLRCFFNTSSNYLDTPLVVDDGRFLFERDSLRGKGWLVVGINTPERVRRERYQTVYGRLPTEVELNHQSEIELPDIIQQAHIVVNGTADPYENVRVILRAARETPQLR